MYDRLGRAALRFALVYLRRRYRRQIRIGAAAGVGLLAVGAFVASRHAPEG